MSNSGLSFYSIGIVVEDKVEGSDLIKVTPMEKLTSLKGVLNSDLSLNKTTIPDKDGIIKTSETKVLSYMSAKWLPINNNNRISAPDVYFNETVMLFKYADTEQYYWTTLFREPALRKQEKTLTAWSNIPPTKDKRLTTYDKKSSYWVEVNTKKNGKRVTFFTAKNDGEYTTWEAYFDTKNGIFEVKDEKGNSYKIDSKQDTVTVKAIKRIILDAPEIICKGRTVGCR